MNYIVVLSIDRQARHSLPEIVKWCSRAFGCSFDSTVKGTWLYRWCTDQDQAAVYNFYFLNFEDSAQFSLRWL